MDMRAMPLAPPTSDKRATTKRCLRCAYSLQDTGDSQNCPECGLAVRISFYASDALDWSNPAWVRRLAYATRLLALANAGVLASVAIAVIGGFVDDRPLWDRYKDYGFWMQAPDMLGGCSFMLMAISAVLLAAPERREPESLALRRRVLLIASAVCVAFVAAEILQTIGAITIGWWPSSILTGPVTSVLVAVWWYLNGLTRRMPSLAVRGPRYTRDAAIALVAGFLLFIFVARSQVESLLLEIRLDPLGWPARPWTFAAIAYLFATTGLLAYLAARFFGAAWEAGRNWVTDP
jgi:hypothetical protein